MSVDRHTARFLRARQAIDQQNAIDHERTRLQAVVGALHHIDATLDALRGDDPVPLFRINGDRIVEVDLATLRRHALILGASGFGKSWFKAKQFLEILGRAERRIVATGATTLGFAMVVLDVKSETVQIYKRIIAETYLRAHPRVREILRNSVEWTGWERHRLTPIAAFDLADEISIEYQAKIKTDVLTRASRSPWSESLVFLCYQTFRVLIERDFPLNLRVIELLCRDERFRSAIVSKLRARDLADFWGRLPQRIAPQTIEAFIRRIAIELAYPLVRLAVGVPSSARPHRSTPAAISLIDAGTSNALPPSVAMALADWILTDVFFAASRRDPAVPMTITLEEAAVLLAISAELLDLVINGQRMLRSAGVNIEFCTQALDSLPSPAVREMVLNAVTITAFQSTRDIAEMLFPHMAVERGDQPLDFVTRVRYVCRGDANPAARALPETSPLRERRRLDADEPCNLASGNVIVHALPPVRRSASDMVGGEPANAAEPQRNGTEWRPAWRLPRNRSRLPHAKCLIYWSGRRDSNPRPRAWEAPTLPTELRPLDAVNPCVSQ